MVLQEVQLQLPVLLISCAIMTKELVMIMNFLQ